MAKAFFVRLFNVMVDWYALPIIAAYAIAGCLLYWGSRSLNDGHDMTQPEKKRNCPRIAVAWNEGDIQ